MRPAEADAIALWALGAHGMDQWMIFPRLLVTAPEKGCGKTTLLDLISRLVPRPLAASNVTAAALFRTIKATRPTLALDEADAYCRDNEDLRSVLDAGHRRDGAVIRVVGDDHEPRQFSAWAAVAVAAIGRLPGTIEDRSIVIRLRRRRPDEPIKPLRLGRVDDLNRLARMATRWAEDHAVALATADPEMPAAIYNRVADNWRPLLTLADTTRGDWPRRAREAAVALTSGSEDDGSIRVRLLADLRKLFAAESDGVLFTADILEALHGRVDRPWPEYRGGRPITVRQLAKLLGPLGIDTNRTVRRDSRVAKGYRAADLADAWARYRPIPPLVSVTSVTSEEIRGFQGDFIGYNDRSAPQNVTDEGEQDQSCNRCR